MWPFQPICYTTWTKKEEYLTFVIVALFLKQTGKICKRRSTLKWCVVCTSFFYGQLRYVKTHSFENCLRCIFENISSYSMNLFYVSGWSFNTTRKEDKKKYMLSWAHNHEECEICTPILPTDDILQQKKKQQRPHTNNKGKKVSISICARENTIIQVYVSVEKRDRRRT